MSDLVLTDDADGVRVVTFNRPDVLNAFDTALYRAAADALRAAAVDDEVRVVVLTGAGRAFSAGQDLTEMVAMGEAMASGGEVGSGFPDFVDAVVEFPKPLVAAVNGVGVGIGFTLLGLVDVAFLDEKARFRTPFTELGVAPEAASSFTFPARMGWQRAAQLLFGSNWVTAAEAVDLGLAVEVCPAGTAVERALAWATPVAGYPLASLLATKAAMVGATAPLVAAARAREDDAFSRLLGSFEVSAVDKLIG